MKIRKLCAIICMGIAVLLSFRSYTAIISKSSFGREKTKTVSFSFKPDYLSTLMAVLMYLPVVIRLRQQKRLMKSVSDTVVTILNILFCASFLSFFFGGNAWNIPIIHISSKSVVIIAIIASWICLPTIAGFIWLFLFVIAVPRMATGNIAMGLWGVVYIISAFMGFCLQTDTIGNVLPQLKREFFIEHTDVT